MPPLTFKNVDAFCSRINLDEERPLVDLSVVAFVEPFALVYLGMYLRHYNAQGRYFNWRMPDNQSVRQYFARMNFYKRFNFSPKVVIQEKLYRFTSSTSFDDMIDIPNDKYIAEEIADKLKELLLRENIKVPVLQVCEATAEVIDNFSQHANEQLAIMTVQW